MEIASDVPTLAAARNIKERLVTQRYLATTD